MPTYGTYDNTGQTFVSRASHGWVYTLKDAMDEVEADRLKEEARAAKAAEPKVYVFEVKDPINGKILGKREIRYTDEADLQKKMAAELTQLRLQMNWKDLSTAPATASRATTDNYDESQLAKVSAEVDAFLAETPSYVANESNMNALSVYIGNNGLKPTLANFRLAYEACSKAGMFVDSRGVPLVPQGAPSRVSPTGDRSGIQYTLPNGRTVYGKQAIDAMDPETYRRRFNGEPGFKEKIDKLYAK